MSYELDDDRIAVLKDIAKNHPKVLHSGLIEEMYYENKFHNLTFNQVKEIFNNLEKDL